MTLTDTSTRTTPRTVSAATIPVHLPRPLASRIAQRQTPGDDDTHQVTIACQEAIATAAPGPMFAQPVPTPFELGLTEHPTLPDYWLDRQDREAIRRHDNGWSVFFDDEWVTVVDRFEAALILYRQLHGTITRGELMGLSPGQSRPLGGGR